LQGVALILTEWIGPWRWTLDYLLETGKNRETNA